MARASTALGLNGLLLCFLLQACNCQPPLTLPTDGGGVGGGTGGSGGFGGGTAGGSGGGTADAGPTGCSSAADCTEAKPIESLCSFTGADAGNSCIDRRCVYDCQPGRTCDWDAGPKCLGCGVTSLSCLQSGCGAQVRQATLETKTSSCVNLAFSSLTLTPLGGCQWTATDGATTVGTLSQVSNGQYVFTSPTLGTCVGLSTFSQVERAVFSCQKCQFQLAL